MKRVTGIGGIFFKCPDPRKTREWYAKHLGFKVDEYGASFKWTESKPAGYTAWSTFEASSNYFGDADQMFMINYRVNDLESLLKTLAAEGVTIVDEIESYEYGKFAHILDCDGRKVELWEPNDEAYGDMIG